MLCSVTGFRCGGAAAIGACPLIIVVAGAAAGARIGCGVGRASISCTISVATARGVGNSKTSVEGSVSPVAPISALASSVAASESMPADCSGVLAITSSEASARTCLSTSASTFA